MRNMTGKTPLAICGLLVLLPGHVFAQEQKNPPYNWSGLYIGAFLGGASASNISTSEPLRLDNLNNWFRPFNNSYEYGINSSFIGGGTLGYNLQVSGTPLIFGIEGEYGYLYEKGFGPDVNIPPYSALTGNFIDNVGGHQTMIGSTYGYGLIGGRIGYAFDRFLLYVKSGAVFTNIKTAYNAVKKETDMTSLATINTSSSVNTVGFGIGGGIEYALPFDGFNNVSLKVEYIYLGIGATQSSFGYCSCHFHWMTQDGISGIHTAKLGLNYRFDAFAP